MEKLQPSEAITELGVWMDAMEKKLKEDHQEIHQASSAAGLQPLLQRHKVLADLSRSDMIYHDLSCSVTV